MRVSAHGAIAIAVAAAALAPFAACGGKKDAPAPGSGSASAAATDHAAPSPDAAATPPSPAMPNTPAPVVVPPEKLVRVSGDVKIAPDPDTAKAMVAAGRTKVISSWKVCIDEHGVVTEATPLRSTGFVAYDQRLAAGIRAWTFQPHQDASGAAVRACTSYTFAWTP